MVKQPFAKVQETVFKELVTAEELKIIKMIQAVMGPPSAAGG